MCEVLSALDGLYSSIIHFLSCWLYYFLPLSGLLLYFQRVWRKTEEKREGGGGVRRAERKAGVMEGQRERDESGMNVCVYKSARLLIVWRRVHMCGRLNPYLITVQSGQTNHHRKFKVRWASLYTQRRGCFLIQSLQKAARTSKRAFPNGAEEICISQQYPAVIVLSKPKQWLCIWQSHCHGNWLL